MAEKILTAEEIVQLLTPKPPTIDNQAAPEKKREIDWINELGMDPDEAAYEAMADASVWLPGELHLLESAVQGDIPDPQQLLQLLHEYQEGYRRSVKTPVTIQSTKDRDDEETEDLGPSMMEEQVLREPNISEHKIGTINVGDWWDEIGKK